MLATSQRNPGRPFPNRRSMTGSSPSSFPPLLSLHGSLCFLPVSLLRSLRNPDPLFPSPFLSLSSLLGSVQPLLFVSAKMMIECPNDNYGWSPRRRRRRRSEKGVITAVSPLSSGGSLFAEDEHFSVSVLGAFCAARTACCHDSAGSRIVTFSSQIFLGGNGSFGGGPGRAEREARQGVTRKLFLG